MDVRAILKAKGSEVATAPPDTTIAAAVAVLAERMIGALVVTDENEALVGIVSERDIVRGLSDRVRRSRLPHRDLHGEPVETCASGDSDREILALMTDRRFRHLPVVEDGKLIGIVSIGDVVKSRIDGVMAEATRCATTSSAADRPPRADRGQGMAVQRTLIEGGWSTTMTAIATVRQLSTS